MSTHRNNSNYFGRLVLTAVVVVIAFITVNKIKTQVNQTVPPLPDRNIFNMVNPIERMVSGDPCAAKEEGIAVAILVDVSGSMEDKVKDANGVFEPKIDIARASLEKIISSAQKFSQANPGKKLVMGIFEFSSRDRRPSCRIVMDFASPDLVNVRTALRSMEPDGGTPIGDAVIMAKQRLDKTGLKSRHILVLTDGENNQGYTPEDVVGVISRMPQETRASIYFVAFDISASRFDKVRSAGGLVLAAADARELNQTLDYVLTGRILAEQPEVPGN